MGHTSFQFDRRAFVKSGALAAGMLVLGPRFLRRAFAAGPVIVGEGPYGPPSSRFDANGIALPQGFSSREIARGSSPVEGSTPPYVWHEATDGQATFPTLDAGGAPDGGWILAANSEVPGPGAAGASAVEFAADGSVERAYRILNGTTANCAGGPTPWGTWLSCEENPEGRVWECDPTMLAPAVRPALGVFKHEAACVDPVGERLYLTEDEGDSCFYRFTPAEYPDLTLGLLEVAIVDGSGNVSWTEVPNPSGGIADPTRSQVAEAARFDGGEGTWFDNGIVYFTTKGDNRLWSFNVVTSRIEILYDGNGVDSGAPLSGLDNVTVSQSGDIYLCEDGGDLDICLITPEFEIARFLKLDPVKHFGPPEGNPFARNETVGVVFDPSGTRMYFGAQRSFGVGGNANLPAGVVYEISGPFRSAPKGPALQPASPVLRVGVKRHRAIPRFLDRGLRISLELDRLAGVEAKLRVRVRRDDGRTRKVTIGQVRTNVAVVDRVDLRLRPGRRAERLLRGRRIVSAELNLRITDGAKKTFTVKRHVTLFRERRRSG